MSGSLEIAELYVYDKPDVAQYHTSWTTNGVLYKGSHATGIIPVSQNDQKYTYIDNCSDDPCTLTFTFSQKIAASYVYLFQAAIDELEVEVFSGVGTGSGSCPSATG